MSWVLKQAFPVNKFTVFKVHGKDLYLANEDFVIRQWSLATHKITGLFSGHEGPITGIECLEDLDALATTSTDGRLLLWSNNRVAAKFLNRQRKTDTFGAPLYCLCYYPYKETLYVGGNAEILLFKVRYDIVQRSLDKNASEDISEIKPFQRIKLHSDIIHKILIANDKLITIAHDHTIGITRLDSPTVNKLIRLKLNQSISSVIYDSIQQVLLVGALDGKLYIISRDGLILQGFDIFPGSSIMSLTQDYQANMIWAISAQGSIKLLDRNNPLVDLTDFFDTLKERPIIGINTYIYFAVHFDPNTAIMYLFLNEHYVLGFQYEPMASRVTLTMPYAFHALCSVNFVPLAHPLIQITNTKKGLITVTESVKEGKYIIGGGQRTFSIYLQESKFKFQKIKDFPAKSKITSIRTHPDFFTFGDTDGNIYAIQTTTMRVAHSAAPVNGSITSLQFVGSFILATTLNGSWHMLTLTEFPDPMEEKRTRLMAHNGSINDSVFSAQSGYLLTAGSDGLVKSWCVGTDLKRLANLPSVFLTGTANVMRETAVADMREYGEVTNIRLHHDGERIITAHSDRQIRVWSGEVENLDLLVTIPCGWCSITAMELDRNSVIVALDDKTLRAFDVDDGRITRTFIGHKDTICAISVGEGLDYIVSSSWDGAVKLWSREEEKPPKPPKSINVRPVNSARRERDARSALSPLRPAPVVSVSPAVSLYERRKQEIERRRRREKAEIEASRKTPLYKDIKALSKLIQELL
ncbi:hypothetical protein TVAG_174830 [Trichomonas vaginalis G3]|uniref:WD repeat protein n=1 Tax=Trichomonas vaginalis (strain ATCC PRA-98 / G3) TaxID=412133 RepID=A2EK29_TRIV3|nr:Beige/BEACH domain-containing protein [Trichomonas vaginalis G3]EAY07013.1 hypothetical protein TVAG_174830 [Trichomonas vaginalis G3]KAI5488807.1 Beige/BEACH domain-containing protein [Trichomonas vaginalis G3]|eukprot:XP_001319236.1 hypothetical protein [Trichomonas vaginalis G3]